MSQKTTPISSGYLAGYVAQSANAVAIGNNAGSFSQGAGSVAIGYQAGQHLQGVNSMAIGYQAGVTGQGSASFAMGYQAGLDSQGNNALAIGYQAGQTGQGAMAESIGYGAGQFAQGTSAIAIGYMAGNTGQGQQAQAIGHQAGASLQGTGAFAVGFQAGMSSQGAGALALGYMAGTTGQNANTTAVGYMAGAYGQNANAVALGYMAGTTGQGAGAYAIGTQAGNWNQGQNAIAMGFQAGMTGQGANAVAVGYQAGMTGQGQNAVAIGYQAGATGQSAGALAVGFQAGEFSQGLNSIAMGTNAGMTGQGANALAVGANAGAVTQGLGAIAFGASAGQFSQGANALAMGHQAGMTGQKANAVAIGFQAGQSMQGDNAFAMGNQAGMIGQGQNAVAIGNQAGQMNQGNNSLAIGYQAGINQGSSTVAVGYQAGMTGQGFGAFAMGYQAGNFGQGVFSMAVGYQAGMTGQKSAALAVGHGAGLINQGMNAMAVGYGAGMYNQAENAFAVGFQAGVTGQGTNTLAMGYQAGAVSQGAGAIAVGYQAGMTGQGQNASAIGYQAGQFYQRNNAVAIGVQAGMTGQGENSVAIGYQAGMTGQKSNSAAIGYLAGQNNQSNNAFALGAVAGQNNQGGGAVAISTYAGQNNQGENAFAAGVGAGNTNQGTRAMAIGVEAGKFSQGIDAFAAGLHAGMTGQGANAAAIGYQAGAFLQGTGAFALGYQAGQSTQGLNAVALGYQAGQSTQGSFAVAVGNLAGATGQNTNAVAIGNFAGRFGQGAGSVAIGFQAGVTGQKANTVAIGNSAGQFNQGANALAIGFQAGMTGQNDNAMALGNSAGQFAQGTGAFAAGFQAGVTGQRANAMAIGFQAGELNQGANAFAAGFQAGELNQGTGAFAAGFQAGQFTQGANALALGFQAGITGQGANSVAMGFQAGETNQGANAFAVGYQAGELRQGANAFAAGFQAGQSVQGAGAVAIGFQAGYTGQGANSIAIGNQAGVTGITPNSIVLNASGVGFFATGPTGAFYVSPISTVKDSGMIKGNILVYGENNQIMKTPATIDSNGAFYYTATPAASQAGTYSVSNFSVTDGKIGSSLSSIAIGNNAGSIITNGSNGSFTSGWTGTTGTNGFKGCAMSSNGYYQVYGTSSGLIISNNSANTWEKNIPIPIVIDSDSIYAISGDGLSIVVCSKPTTYINIVTLYKTTSFSSWSSYTTTIITRNVGHALAVDISKTGQYILLVTTNNVYATDTKDTEILTFKAISCPVTKSNLARNITKGSCSFTQTGLATFVIDDNTYSLDLTTVTYLSNMVIAMNFDNLNINTTDYASTELGISKISRLSTISLPSPNTYYSKSGTQCAIFSFVSNPNPPYDTLNTSSMVADIKLQSSLFTMCFWMYTMHDKWSIAFDLADSNNCTSSQSNPTKIHMEVSPNGGSMQIHLRKAFIGASKRSVPRHTWTHIALVFSNNTVKYYINGLLDVSYPYTLNATFDKLSLGSRYFSDTYTESYPFFGNIDDLRIYNKALTDTDMYNLYALFTHPTMYLSFENGLPDIINGINPSNPVLLDTANVRKYGTQSLRVQHRPDVQQYNFLAYNHPLVKSTNILSVTACAWFNADNFSTLQSIFSLVGSDTDTSGFTNNYNSGGLISVFINNNARVLVNFNGQSPTLQISSSSAVGGGWNHVAVTFTIASMKLYVNGSLAASTADNAITNPINNPEIWQGKFIGGQNQVVWMGTYPFTGSRDLFTGYIDDFRIYDHELPANFISALYNSSYFSKSVPLFYPITSPNSVFHNVITSNPSTVIYTKTPPILNYTIYSAMSANGKYQVVTPNDGDDFYYSNDYGLNFSTKKIVLEDFPNGHINISNKTSRGVYVSNSGRILIAKNGNLILSKVPENESDINKFKTIAPITSIERVVVSIQSSEDFNTIIYGGNFNLGSDAFTFWYKINANTDTSSAFIQINPTQVNGQPPRSIAYINNRRGISLSSDGNRAVIHYIVNTTALIYIELLYNIKTGLQQNLVTLPSGCPTPNSIKISPNGDYILIGGGSRTLGSVLNTIYNTQIYKATINSTNIVTEFIVMPSSPYGLWDTFVINGDNGENIYAVDRVRNVYYSPDAGTTWNKIILSHLYGTTDEFIFSVSTDNNYIFHTNGTRDEILYPCLKLNSNSTINTFTSTDNIVPFVPDRSTNKSIPQILNEKISYISSSFNASSLVINTNIQTYYTNNTGQTWISLQTGNTTGLPSSLNVNGVKMSSDGLYLILSSLYGLYTLNSNYNSSQLANSLAIGNMAGSIGQGSNAIAIGALAGQVNQPSNTIILNASGSALNAEIANGCFIAPIANYTNSTSKTFNMLGYGTDNQIVQIGTYLTPTLTNYVSGGISIVASTAMLQSTKAPIIIQTMQRSGRPLSDSPTDGINSVTAGFALGVEDNITASNSSTRLDVMLSGTANAGNNWGSTPDKLVATFTAQTGLEIKNGCLRVTSHSGETNGNKLGITATTAADSRNYYFSDTMKPGDNNTTGGGYGKISIYATYDIIGGAAIGVFSDARIKKDITDAVGSIDIINKIPLHQYNYIDPERGTHTAFGVIAQEVKAAFPEAIKLVTEYIPNIFCIATSIVSVSSTVQITIASEHGLVVGDKVKIILEKGDRNECKVVSIIDANTVAVEKWDNYDESEKVFLYGKEVNDFHSVDKLRLATLALGGIQDLYKMIKDLQTQVATLQAQISAQSSSSTGPTGPSGSV